ncbi:MAG TPA: TIGR03118 family protein [Iamia sp.]
MARPLRPQRLVAALALALLAASAVVTAPAGPAAAIPIIAPGSAYRQVNLASDLGGVAEIIDPVMINPWGLASNDAGSPLWVANDGTNTAGQYVGTGGGGLVRHATQARINLLGGLPTGIVANGSDGFDVPSTTTGSLFLGVSITGNVLAWASGNTASIAASHPGHVYTGAAQANNGVNDFLYAADFANGTIDVFDENYALQPAVSFPFADPTIPTTMGNTYHPYNIQNVDGSLIVSYAKVGTGGLPEDGVGNGFVRRFNANGVRDLTFGINNGALNSPWGIVKAPATFGIFGGSLLIGNNGDGNPSIHSYNPTTGAFLGTLQDESGNGIVIDELFGLRFGNGGPGGATDTLYFAAGLGEEEHGLLGSLNPTTSSATSLIQFATDDFAISEGSTGINVTVTRSGDVSGPATVRYATWDQSQPGHASQKSDYETAAGLLVFEEGQTSRTFRVLPVNDLFVEGNETIDLMISNPTGPGLGIGTPNTSTLTIVDNDAVAPTANPIDDTTFFVRQQYLDFLGRQPEPAGLTYWVNRINACGGNTACRAAERAKSSGSFFLSAEYQNAAAAVFRTSRAANGRNPLYGEYVVDTSIYRTYGEPAYFDHYVSRPEFVARYLPLTNAQYVDALIANTGVTFTASQRNALVNGLNGATLTRAQALRNITVNAAFVAAEKSRAFVLAQYFGYLRRDADTAGYEFWLDKLADAGGNFVTAGMVANFIQSAEYRQRFGAS